MGTFAVSHISRWPWNFSRINQEDQTNKLKRERTLSRPVLVRSFKYISSARLLPELFTPAPLLSLSWRECLRAPAKYCYNTLKLKSQEPKETNYCKTKNSLSRDLTCGNLLGFAVYLQDDWFTTEGTIPLQIDADGSPSRTVLSRGLYPNGQIDHRMRPNPHQIKQKRTWYKAFYQYRVSDQTVQYSRFARALRPSRHNKKQDCSHKTTSGLEPIPNNLSSQQASQGIQEP